MLFPLWPLWNTIWWEVIIIKKIQLAFVVFLLTFNLNSSVVHAKSNCAGSGLGNVQCFRMFCNSNQVKVCKSNAFCNCYDIGEKISEGQCSGLPAKSGLACTEYGGTGTDIVEEPLRGCNGDASINTAIGCIPFDSQDSFLSFFLSWAIGIGGGIAFLLILLAGFQITTSSGNPERLKAGQELLTSAIAGLIMLIFSVFILRVIGVDVLGLDQFGFGK